MTLDRSAKALTAQIRELLRLPKETEWVEFKGNNDDAQEIGEYLSALANSAALAGKAFAYLLWGIDDATRAVVGTGFAPLAEKRGNEELESWLLRLLAPRIDFRFFEVELEEGRVVLLEIGRAIAHPVKFASEEYIRVGSYKKKLKDFPEKERALWRLLDRAPFEVGIAAEQVASEDVLRLLDTPAYFDLLDQALPDGRAAILDALKADGVVVPCETGAWKITNLGAALLAKRLDDFPGLKRKALRVIVYRGKDRLETERERVVAQGYACGFEAAVELIMTLLPSKEILSGAFQRPVPMFPEAAVRELVANALIHQDFAVTGAGPMVELFVDRIEITNPGEPLVSTDRFLDSPPKSRNEGLASLLRRFNICEERGSGIDKVVRAVEELRLPAPLFEVPQGFTRVVLFGPRPLADIDRLNLVQAVYLHACLKWI